MVNIARLGLTHTVLVRRPSRLHAMPCPVPPADAAIMSFMPLKNGAAGRKLKPTATGRYSGLFEEKKIAVMMGTCGGGQRRNREVSCFMCCVHLCVFCSQR